MCQKTQGSRTLHYAYHTGGRLTKITDEKGKIIETRPHNYLFPFPNSPDFPLVETYEYRGRLSALSQLTTRVEGLHGTPAPVFTQTMSYNAAGNLETHTYPACSGTVCTGADDLPAPNHTVTTSYTQSVPTQVTSSRGPWGRYTYHPNFQTAGLDYKNGVSGTFDQGPNGLARPQRIRYTRSGAVPYDSGSFHYDEATNIYQIGGDTYRYDKASLHYSYGNGYKLLPPSLTAPRWPCEVGFGALYR